MNIANSLFLITFFSSTIDGSDNAVTLIMKLNTVPSPAPLKYNASAIGIAPKISAYMGIPIIDASITDNGLLLPRAHSMNDCGIQLCINAPIPTPTKM